MIRHRAPISGIAAFESAYVATAGYDSDVILWDARTRAGIARSCHDHLANQCAFSPSGKELCSSSSDYTARVWSIPNLRLLRVFEHDDDVEMAVFHPTLPLLATASRDHRVRVFALDGSRKTVLEGHGADVISVTWGAGKDDLVSTSDDGTIRRWDAARGVEIERVDMQGVETDTVAIAEDGSIYAGNDAGEIAVIAKGTVTKIEAHAAGIKRVVVEPRRKRLLTLSYDRAFKIWDTSGAAPRLKHAGEMPSVVWPRAAAFAGEQSIAFATFGTTYAVYDLERHRMDVSSVEATWGMNAVAMIDRDVFSVGDAGVVMANGAAVQRLGSLMNFLTPFGHCLLTGGQAGVLFDARRGTRIHQHRSPLNCAATFSRNGELKAIVGTYTGEGLLFGLRDGEPVFEREVRLHDNAVKGVASSRGLVFSVSANRAAAFHTTQSFGLVRRVDAAHDRIANGCAGLRHGEFVSVSRDRALRIWSADRTERIDTPHTHSIKCVAVSGEFVATGAYDGAVAILDLRTRRWTHIERPTTWGISSLASAGDDFVASSYDGSIYRITGHRHGRFASTAFAYR